MIPYGRQSINEQDIEAVLKVLRSDWLTQGPSVQEFEEKLAKYCGAGYAVVCNSGTSALHAAFVAAGIGKGDEFIVPTITFPATSNVGLWSGALPVFVDSVNNGNIDSEKIEEKITAKTKAIVPVDFTGRPVDLDKIKEIARKHHLLVIEDACQALGASYDGVKIGAVADLTAFSFHPVKNITTAEGGAVVTSNEKFYKIMKQFVTHGVTKENFENESPGAWWFEQQFLGLNYRLTDMQAALGISQLSRLDSFLEKRRKIVKKYNQAFENIINIRIPEDDTDKVKSAWHLYVIELVGDAKDRRAEVFKKLRESGVGVQVHHVPVHYHPYYERLGFHKGLAPNAERLYEAVLSLPLYPDLTQAEQNYVIEKVLTIVGTVVSK